MVAGSGAPLGARWRGARAGAPADAGWDARGRPGAVVLVLWLLTLVVAPLVSRLVAMTVSRHREYLADATAAQFTRNPAALARALEKLDDVRTPTLAVGRGAAALCIVDPSDLRFQRWKGAFGDLLASHPPIEERVRRLEAMQGR